MRTQGSLRLILNTKLWAQMQVDKASEKSVRITAMDTEDQGVKVFLISVRLAPMFTIPRETSNDCLGTHMYTHTGNEIVWLFFSNV